MPESPYILTAHVPVSLKMPEEMRPHLEKVLRGEYEAGYFGSGLTILDVGANAGAFTVWAHMRWPSSTIHAYEPQPDTFQILEENVGSLPNVHCHNAAVYPSGERTVRFVSRYAGDGEAGIASVMSATFSDMRESNFVEVPVVQPCDLPPADVIKLDVEGSEYEILANMKVGEASLILLEFQFARTRDAIKRLLAGDFTLEKETAEPWDAILDWPAYREDLAGDEYGLLMFSNRRQNRLLKVQSSGSPSEIL